MSKVPKAPAKTTPEPSAFKRMKDFTRRLVAVPKSKLPNRKPRKGKRDN